MVQALAVLENKLAALDAYLKVALPPAPAIDPANQQTGLESGATIELKMPEEDAEAPAFPAGVAAAPPLQDKEQP